MQIDWWTLGLQAVNFAVLVWLLRRFLYAPIRQVIEDRRAQAGAALAAAEEARKAAEAERAGLAADRADVAAERVGILNAARDAAAEERKAMLARAKDEADALIRTGREVLAEDRRVAIEGAQTELADLAETLARSILEEAQEGGLLDHVAAQLTALPAEERRRLLADLKAPKAEIQVVTAEPLAAPDEAAWRDRLEAEFNGARLGFDTDPAILGGAELHFPHSSLKLSWAAKLANAREAIEGDERI